MAASAPLQVNADDVTFFMFPSPNGQMMFQAPVMILKDVFKNKKIDNRFTIRVKHWSEKCDIAANKLASDNHKKLTKLGASEQPMFSTSDLHLLKVISPPYIGGWVAFDTFHSIQVSSDKFDTAESLKEALIQGDVTIYMTFSVTLIDVISTQISCTQDQIFHSLEKASAKIGGAEYVHGGIAANNLLSSNQNTTMNIYQDKVEPKLIQLALHFVEKLQKASEDNMTNNADTLREAIDAIKELEKANFKPDEYKPVTAMWNITTCVKDAMNLHEANEAMHHTYTENRMNLSANASARHSFGLTKVNG